jgi:hypothetical protein
MFSEKQRKEIRKKLMFIQISPSNSAYILIKNSTLSELNEKKCLWHFLTSELLH